MPASVGQQQHQLLEPESSLQSSVTSVTALKRSDLREPSAGHGKGIPIADLEPLGIGDAVHVADLVR